MKIPAAGNGGDSLSASALEPGDHVHPTPIDLAANDADTRALADLLDQAAEAGLVLSRRCRRCRQPLTDRRSVLAGVGPRCALKGGAR